MTLKRNIEHVLTRVKDATSTSNQELNDIQLIAVTKTINKEDMKKAIALGVKDIGENRVEELERKMNVLNKDINYHMIGHLQTNKVKYIIDRVKLIHSLDRMSLTKELDKRSKNHNINIDTLVSSRLRIS